jgi:large subunit ribosomal protein L16
LLLPDSGYLEYDPPRLDYWVAVVKPGRIIFEVAGVRQEQAKEALRLASQKLPLSTSFVSRADLQESA